MKIACYCQHVLGIGHFHRSLEICRTLAASDHETIMIIGGPPLTLPRTDVQFFQLPGLMMDEDFSQLLPCEPGQQLSDIKKKRQQQLFHFFKTFQPDVFLVELYPFGRKAFRFELDPILDDIAPHLPSPCLRLCSLRDILVEKKDREKYERRVIERINSSFDGLLIHSDPEYIPLDTTFKSIHAITTPTHYTGFIARPAATTCKSSNLRKKFNISKNDKLVVASIGGGNVGGELLLAVAKASRCLKEDMGIHFYLFTGLYTPQHIQSELTTYQSSNLHIHGFTDTFPEWLQAADLSVSMAGYNTCMNLLLENTPALLYPFAQNREQRQRVSAFTGCCNFNLLEPEDLNPEHLADIILRKLLLAKQPNSVDLNGALKSSELITDISLWSGRKT